MDQGRRDGDPDDFSDDNAPLPPPSPLERLDPRTRLLAAVAAALVFSAAPDASTAGLCLFLGLALAVAARPRAGRFFRYWGAANLFIAFMVLTIPLGTPGEAWAVLGPLSWSREGLESAWRVALKANAVWLAFAALAGGLEPAKVGGALEGLRVPAKLVFLFLSTGRYIHVVGGEWRRLSTAARLRGFAGAASMHGYRTLAQRLGLTLTGAVDRSRRVYEAMLLRGFDGSFRTVSDRGAGRADAVFAALFATALTLLALAIKNAYPSIPR